MCGWCMLVSFHWGDTEGGGYIKQEGHFLSFGTGPMVIRVTRFPFVLQVNPEWGVSGIQSLLVTDIYSI